MERNQVSNVAWTVREPQDGLAVRTRFAVADLGVFDLTETGPNSRVLEYDIDFKGRLIAVLALVEEVTTDTNADATLAPKVWKRGAGVAVSGGLLTLADKNDGTNPVAVVGAVILATRITLSDSQVIPGDTVRSIWAVTNPFVDGKVRVIHVYETET